MYFSKIVFLTVFAKASCFAPNRPLLGSHHDKIHRRVNMSDRGWDNGSFLDALGGEQSALDEANLGYQKESEARSFARDKSLQAMAHDGEFQEFQSYDDKQQPQYQQPQFAAPPQEPQQTFTPPPPPPPMPQQQPQQAPMGQGGQPAPMDPQAYFQALQAWQQAMVVFQQFSVANPQAAAQMTPPPPPPPPPAFTDQTMAPPVQTVQTVQTAQPVTQQQQQQPIMQATDTTTEDDDDEEVTEPHQYLPKRAGGNNDAYEVNNSADVYFAQLKRDSNVRIEARKRGDMETANAPFAEKGVKALTGLISEELVNSRRERLAENGGEFETSRDEMILPLHFADSNDNDVDKTYTGNSYKEKLMQAKKNREKN